MQRISEGMLTRRKFLTTGSLAAGSMACGRFLSAQSAGGPIVETPSGPLQGLTTKGVNVFRGIPFAQKPVGDSRFRPAEKVSPWRVIRDATVFSHSAIQAVGKEIEHSEDCLYLNVWAPAKETKTRGSSLLPVWVWVHGGGYVNGSSFDPIFDGAAFAREGIVCVTVGYRLGVFGFLDFEPLLGSAYAGTANNGLGDLAMALGWIRENIAAFGGDRNRVTVGGASAGAKLTDTLLGSPRTGELYQQAISESGGAERVLTLSQAETLAEAFGKLWRDDTGRDNTFLLTAPADMILKVQTKLVSQWPSHFPLRPQIDTKWLPRLPIESIRAGSTRSKALLCGTNRDESVPYLGPHPQHDPVSTDLGNLSLSKFDPVYSEYEAVYPNSTAEQRRIRAVSAEEYWVPSVRLVEAHTNTGGRAWMYRVDFTETKGPFPGNAYHGIDVRLVWNQPNALVGNVDEETSIAQKIHQAWCAFIRGEAPAAPGLPDWPRYNTETRKTMLLDNQSQVVEQPNQRELDLWDRVL